ncbi:MAG: hypothetical protein H0X39_04750 [Actinobacteria bacterium]|nr:hypothetical protein [Actinomycetota bacterium]
MLARIAPFAVVALCVLAAPAVASSPPVGPLPAGPTTQITTQRGALVAIALPPQPAGRAWRLKGNINTRIVREVSEANVGANVVVVFKATGKGSTSLAYGATRGETAKAYAAKRFHLTVR